MSFRCYFNIKTCSVVYQLLIQFKQNRETIDKQKVKRNLVAGGRGAYKSIHKKCDIIKMQIIYSK
jgi:hypothetical protein